MSNTQDSARILSRLEIKGVVTTSAGAEDGLKFIKTNDVGKLDTSLYNSDITSHLTDATKHLTSLQNTWLDSITASAAELNYVVGVTSAIQTQLDAKTSALNSHTGDATQHLSSQQNTWLDSIESTNNLPAWNGAALTSLNASNLASGTIPDTRFPSTLPALSGANLTALNAGNIASGSLAIARIAGYPSNASMVLKGDATWNYHSHGVLTVATSATLALIHSDAIIRSTGAGSTLLIPTNAAAAFQIGTVIRIINEGATGTMTISPDSGVTLDSPGSSTTVTVRYGEVVLKKLDTNLWHMSGNLA